MAKRRNIESASVFERSGIRAIRARIIEALLYLQPPVTSAISQARSGKSTLGLERENSSFIDPKIGGPDSDEVWNKASNMWHFKNQPTWGNLGHHKH